MLSTSLREVGTNPFASNDLTTGQSVGEGDADAQLASMVASMVAPDLNFLCSFEAEQPFKVVADADQRPLPRHLDHST